jgi:hypothetical protein
MTNLKRSELSLLDVVALLTDSPTAGLARGQVGTVVEISGKDARWRNSAAMTAAPVRLSAAP